MADNKQNQTPKQQRLKEGTETRAGLRFQRVFTKPGVHPFDEVKWEKRDAVITDSKGKVVFEQKDVEAPTFWSQTACNIAASRYFRGTPGTPEREVSIKQLIGRVADTIAKWGREGSYFATEEDAQAFQAELSYMLLNQYAAFNSPVWFNVGIEPQPQCSACFILHIDDDMDAISNNVMLESRVFKWGSGVGVNLSSLRSTREYVRGGGHASGPLSFLKVFDQNADVIKSGGKTRRAACMRILNADHPDIMEFIDCKVKEERKARALIAAGYDGGIAGEAYSTVRFQNANHSVRVTDEFMQAVLEDKEWTTHLVTKPDQPGPTYKAREMMQKIAEAAWECGDPGLQFDTICNKWHTCPNSGRINGSNPCFTADTRIATDKGLIRFDEIMERVGRGEEFQIHTHNLTNGEAPADSVKLSKPSQWMVTGQNPVYKLTFSNGMEVKCTANHRLWTTNRGWVRADELQSEDAIQLLNHSLELPNASHKLDLDTSTIFGIRKGRGSGKVKPLSPPQEWSNPLAEYIGYLIGDGCVTAKATRGLRSTSVVFGDTEEKSELSPRFESLFSNLGVDTCQKVAMPNGTFQLRVNRQAWAGMLQQLGVQAKRAPFKTVPESIFQAPPTIACAFLRGLFTADGCVYQGENKTLYAGLGSASLELLQGVQQLLLAQGIASGLYKIREECASRFSYTKKDGTARNYRTHAAWDLRITGTSLASFAVKIGFLTRRKNEKLEDILALHNPYRSKFEAKLRSIEPAGVETTYNLTEPLNHSYLANGLVVSNCSEYMSVDNSSCNLSSINLLKFRTPEGGFDTEKYKHAVRLMFTGQEMLIDNASYPSEKIMQNSRNFRQIGLGYANLGALLMSYGLAYDGEDARNCSAALTALMTGEGYKQSALIAQAKGNYAAFQANKEPQLKVIGMHREHAYQIQPQGATKGLLEAALKAWDEALELSNKHGVRNSQISLLAPTGTIGFLMDCDTTGIEPDLALVKYKWLVGGGMMKLVNNTVPAALNSLGYSEQQVQEIIKYIDSNDTIEGAPFLKEEHLPVFDCAFKPAKGKRSIQWMGHLRMMAAVQPFLSGAISKTVNMPADTTPQDIESAYMNGWKMGLKAVAIYRDGCKSTQPLTTSKEQGEKSRQTVRVEEKIVYKPLRRRMPAERKSITHKFSIAGHEGYLVVGMYEDGTPGEIFIKMSKEGSAISGLMDSFAIAVSIAMQCGVPLKDLASKFINSRFEPAGVTSNPEIRFAKSLVDYIFKWLSLKFLTGEELAILGLTAPELHPSKQAATEAKAESEAKSMEPYQPPATSLTQFIGNPSTEPVVQTKELTSNDLSKTMEKEMDAPPCPECGAFMVRNGACYKCLNCGATSGCS